MLQPLEDTKTGVPCEDAGLVMDSLESWWGLLGSDGLLGVVLSGLLVAEPGAAGHFHAAFLFGSVSVRQILTCQVTAEVHRAVENTDDL